LKEAQYLTVPVSTALCHVTQLDLSFSNSSLLLLANHTLLAQRNCYRFNRNYTGSVLTVEP